MLTFQVKPILCGEPMWQFFYRSLWSLFFELLRVADGTRKSFAILPPLIAISIATAIPEESDGWQRQLGAQRHSLTTVE